MGHTTSCDVSGGVHHGFTSLSLFYGQPKLTGASVPKILFFKGGKAAVSVSLRGLTSVRKAFSTAFFIRSLLPSGPTKKATAPLYTLAARARASVKEEILIVAREWFLDFGRWCENDGVPPKEWRRTQQKKKIWFVSERRPLRIKMVRIF